MVDERPAVPAVEAPNWDGIPASMAQRQQWVLWKYEWDQRRSAWLKVPYYAMGGRRTGDQGSDRDRMRLSTLDVARRAFERKQGQPDAWAGVGFGFLPGDGLIGLDLDKMLDPATGEMTERCRKIIQAFKTYTEISPSGTGVHLYMQGHTTTAKSNDIGVELFCEKQYFTVTGRQVPDTPDEVVPADEVALRRLHATIQEAKDLHKAPPASAAASSRHQPGPRDGRDDFAYVNGEAMRALHAWVPALFGGREIRKGQGYRVTSKSLGRDLQEDLAIHPEGIKDWGVADMGDARNGARSPVDLVMEWGPGTGKPAEALRWLAKVLGLTLNPPGPVAQPSAAAAQTPAAKNLAPAGGAKLQVTVADAAGGTEPAAPQLSDEEMKEKLEACMVYHRGRPMDCRENVMYCMQWDPALHGLVRFNDFSRLLERGDSAPWGRGPGEWDEEDDLMLGEYLLRTHGLGVKAKSTLADGVLMAARGSKYNPIIDLIKSEPWDGVNRLEHWLVDVYDVEDREYTRLIGKCFMMGLVKRALQPGCKFDYMLIIKGDQGLKKSSAFRELAYPYFTDNAIRVGEKDSQMAMQLAWIVESAELESLNKSESTTIKQHLSAQEDWYRPPYGSKMVKAPRHSVNVGTTNADAFLRDATGDRRFWPLEVHMVNVEALKLMRAQLLAEAYARLQKGEIYWPTREQERELIFPEQEQFKRSDPWEDMLDEYVNGIKPLKAVDVPPSSRDFFPRVELYEVLGIKADRIDGNGQMDTRISNAMKTLGFKAHRESKGVTRRRGFLRAQRPGQQAPSSAPQVASVAQDVPDVSWNGVGEHDPLPF